MSKIVNRRIKWTASTASDVTGYKLYWKADGTVDYTSTSVNVGNVTSVIIPTDVPTFPLTEATMSIGITAVDDIGNESDMVVISAPFDFAAPDAPTSLAVETV